MIFKCQNCGIDFSGKPHIKRKYCSQRCFGKINSRGNNNPNWKGGKEISIKGYVSIFSPDHPQKTIRNSVPESKLIVEMAIGRFLRKGAVIHHFDRNKSNNTNSNLIVCQDTGYHNLIERRARAFRHCGHATWIKCRYCGRYDDRKNLWIDKRDQGRHVECAREYKRKLKERNA